MTDLVSSRSSLKSLGLGLLLASGIARAAPVKALVVDYEGGPLYVIQNENRYGAGGTLYQASEVGQQRTLFAVDRTSVEWRMAERHALILLYAPLVLTTRATLGRDLVFREATFQAGRTVDHRYLFDGYRASYLFRLLGSDRFELEIGGSAQVRSAEVSFTDVESGLYAVEGDIGLVVALKARARYTASSGLYAMVDADAISSFGLFGGGGALVDAALTMGVPLSGEADFFLRLRYLGGGADVPRRDLYNWAHLGIASLGLRVDLAGLFSRGG